MGIIISIIIVLFLLGSWLLVLRSANNHKLPPNVKSKPYLDEDEEKSETKVKSDIPHPHH